MNPDAKLSIIFTIYTMSQITIIQFHKIVLVKYLENKLKREFYDK